MTWNELSLIYELWKLAHILTRDARTLDFMDVIDLEKYTPPDIVGTWLYLSLSASMRLKWSEMKNLYEFRIHLKYPVICFTNCRTNLEAPASWFVTILVLVALVLVTWHLFSLSYSILSGIPLKKKNQQFWKRNQFERSLILPLCGYFINRRAPTTKQTDGRYQTYYLPFFAVDKKKRHENLCPPRND